VSSHAVPLGTSGRSPHDVRLVPAALAVWATTLLGLDGGWVLSATVAVLAAFAVPLTSFILGPGTGSRALLAVLVLMTASATGMALRSHQVQNHPLRTAAEIGTVVTAHVTLGAEPKPLHGPADGNRKAEDSATVRAELTGVDLRDRSGRKQHYRAGGSVLLLVPTRQWAGTVAGQQATVRAKAVPSRKGELLVAVLRVSRPPTAISPPPSWQRTAGNLRRELRQTCRAALDPAAAALLPGLVVGDVSALPREVAHDFEKSGLTHLTAVSGANLAIVCGAALVLLHVLGLGARLSALGAAAVLVGFVILAGPEPSVLRAAVMGAVALLGLVLGRDRSALPSLAATVLVLLLLQPSLATDVGFALSVAATAGVVVVSPLWAAALRARGFPPKVAELLAVAGSAHLLTAPVLAAVSGEVSVVAVVANVLAEPVVAPATVLGVLATLLGPVSPWLSTGSVRLAAPELDWLLAVAHHAAGVPGGEIPWPSGVFGGVLLAASAVVALVVLRSNRVRWAVAVLVPVRILRGWPDSRWSAVVCDVGQGDGLALATGNPGEAVLVDTGPDPALTAECLRRLGIRRVPLVVLTHLHADHASGLPAVLANERVGAVAVGMPHEPAWAMAEVTAQARQHRVPLVRLVAGRRLRWPGLAIDVLGPTGPLADTTSAEDANDASTVLRATTPAGRVLLTGDISLPGQAQLLASRADLRAEVLKVPHHGSRYTAPQFLAAVRPRLALISVGRGNRHGHPSPALLGMLQGVGAQILRTDRDGDIAVLPGRNGPRSERRGDPVGPDHR
jgi:competence protein ComEC